MNELMLLASRNASGQVVVEMQDGQDVDDVIAAVIRAAALHGADMGRIFRLVQQVRVHTTRPTEEPMVIA